jgi:hypothetical protein
MKECTKCKVLLFCISDNTEHSCIQCQKNGNVCGTYRAGNIAATGRTPTEGGMIPAPFKIRGDVLMQGRHRQLLAHTCMPLWCCVPRAQWKSRSTNLFIHFRCWISIESKFTFFIAIRASQIYKFKFAPACSHNNKRMSDDEDVTSKLQTLQAKPTHDPLDEEGIFT